MSKPVTAWSYSRWRLFEECPFKFQQEVIEGVKQPMSEAGERGTAIHKEAERYIMQPPGGALPVPLSIMTHFEELIRAVRALPRRMAEFELSFTRALKKTGWMSRDTWWRNKLDVFAIYEDDTVDIIDWKSGREHPEHTNQQETYGLAGFLFSPAVKEVRTRMAYIDSGVETVMEFKRDADLEPLKKKWVGRGEQLISATQFPPTPGAHCRWCHVRHSIGGVCKFG